MQAAAVGRKKWLKRKLVLNHSLVTEIVAESKTSAVVGKQNRAQGNLLRNSLDRLLHELPALVTGSNISSSRIRKHIADDEDQRESKSKDKQFLPALAIHPTGETDRHPGHREARKYRIVPSASIRIESGNRQNAINEKRKR